MRALNRSVKDRDGWLYRSGGNPPDHAGIFTKEGERLAWWPAGYAPSPENFDIAYRLIIRREDGDPAVSREKIAKLIDAEVHAEGMRALYEATRKE